MLDRAILEDAPPPERQAIVTPAASFTWGELKQATLSILTGHTRLAGRRVGMLFQSPAGICAAMAALQRLECDVFLLDGRLTPETAMSLARNFKLGAVLAGNGRGAGSAVDLRELDGESPGSGRGTVTILTSGSTGDPKAATHTWASLARPVRKAQGDLAPRWLLTYRPNLYAGLQIILQCLLNAGTLVAPDAESSPQSIAELMVSAKAGYASATPSYWRRLVLFASPDSLKQCELKQVTLGGEVVDQPLLDKLKECFPSARLAHIYATTELGRCFSVTDGRAGFPASYLGGVLPDGVELKVEEGELLAKSSNAMRDYDALGAVRYDRNEWFRTGDMVNIEGDRVFFVGRKTEMINVGGNKVFPLEVERVLRHIPGVSDVRVFGKGSSIAGQLVACEIVPEKGHDGAVVRERVMQASLAKLAAYQRPRFVEVVTQIGVSAAGKTIRKSNE